MLAVITMILNVPLQHTSLCQIVECDAQVISVGIALCLGSNAVSRGAAFSLADP